MTEVVTPPEQDAGLAKKHARRFWWSAAGCIVLLLGLIAYVVFGYDCAPPEDGWMIPAPFAPASGPHSIPELEKKIGTAVNAFSNEKIKLTEDVRTVARGHSGEAKAFLDKYRATLQEWDAFLAANHDPLPFPGGTDKLDFSATSTYLSMFNTGATLAAMQSRVLAFEGNPHQAAQESLALVRLGKQLSAEGATLIQWLVGMTVQSVGRASLEYIAREKLIEEADFPSIERALAETEVTPREFSRTMQTEYLSYKHSFVAFAKVRGGPSVTVGLDVPWWVTSTIKTNLTHATLLELQRPIFEACHKDWRDVHQTAKEVLGNFARKQKEPMRRFASANIGGNWLLSLALPPEEKIIERSLRNAASHRQALLMLALRRFEKDQGRLPANLQELCPKYLAAVPLDPYNNVPMNWNAATQVVYSVGEDLHDDGGAVSAWNSRSRSKDKDIGMIYWWWHSP